MVQKLADSQKKSLLPLSIEEFGVIAFPIFINRFQENYVKEAQAIEYFTKFLQERYPEKLKDSFEVKIPIPPSEIIGRFKKADITKSHALRNSDIVNQATRYALLLGSDVTTILVGSNINDAFADNSLRYWRRKTEEIREGTRNNDLEVVAPYQESKWDKAKMISWCYEHDIPIHKSWSCWYSNRLHCGKCSPCKRRKEAFAKANIDDPTGYSH